MLVVASHLLSDELARRGINVTPAAGDGQASDAALALAPMLGIPVTLLWTALNFGVFSIVQWSYRTDFRAMIHGKPPTELPADVESSGDARVPGTETQ